MHRTWKGLVQHVACSTQYESLRNEHGKDWSSTWHVVHNMANRVESAEERQERLRRRRERYRIRRERETDEERESRFVKCKWSTSAVT